jgi:hypothetical protein
MSGCCCFGVAGYIGSCSTLFFFHSKYPESTFTPIKLKINPDNLEFNIVNRYLIFAPTRRFAGALTYNSSGE